MKLDLGCGQNKREGFKGVDVAAGPVVDFVVDLEKFPWKEFADGSIEEIHASHYVEHTPDLIKFMDEVWRICADGAKITIIAPYYTSIRCWQDPTHKRAISEATWLYFNKEWRKANKLDHYGIKSHFDVVNMVVFFNPPWDKKTEEARLFAQQHYFNVISDIMIELKAVK
jgi:predicted SAM-dependent methyltransferase